MVAEMKDDPELRSDMKWEFCMRLLMLKSLTHFLTGAAMSSGMNGMGEPCELCLTMLSSWFTSLMTDGTKKYPSNAMMNVTSRRVIRLASPRPLRCSHLRLSSTRGSSR